MLASDDPPQRVKGQFLRESIDRGEELITSYAAPMQIVRLGDELMIVALSGEPVVDWSHKLKREFERESKSLANAYGNAASHATSAAAYRWSGSLATATICSVTCPRAEFNPKAATKAAGQTVELDSRSVHGRCGGPRHGCHPQTR